MIKIAWQELKSKNCGQVGLTPAYTFFNKILALIQMLIYS